MKYLLVALVAAGLMGGVSVGFPNFPCGEGHCGKGHLDVSEIDKLKQDKEKEMPRKRNPVTDTEAEKKRVYFAPTRESSNSESKDLPGVR